MLKSLLAISVNYIKQWSQPLLLRCVIPLILLAGIGINTAQTQSNPRNVVFILSDDHRYDYMNFHPESPDFLETPGMDRMAEEGAHLQNAFVSTSLCSPSRATILTGQYAFRHGAIDNSNPMREDVTFFPEQLQKEGYETAFIGKWHIGESHDDPKPGFDRWISFKGQGVYYNPRLNIDGERKEVEGYITDLLTDYAVDWLDEGRNKDKPFFLYLSHKAVHSQFRPAKRHEGKYSDVTIPKPQGGKNIESNYEGKPRWVQEQRYSWHGVDHAYHGRDNLDQIIRRYSESLMAVDESISRVINYLEEQGLAEETLVIYMGDNGFMFGEHGLIDKRNAYEESMRVPMLAWAPGTIKASSKVDEVILNTDIGPTILDIANGDMPADHKVDGRSFMPLLKGENVSNWRDQFVYQYFWEHAFPHTPTTYAIRGARYKYIYYHGVWDTNELYDLKNDPNEMHNLIDVPHYSDQVDSMRNKLFNILGNNNAMDVQFRRPPHFEADERKIHKRTY